MAFRVFLGHHLCSSVTRVYKNGCTNSPFPGTTSLPVLLPLATLSACQTFYRFPSTGCVSIWDKLDSKKIFPLHDSPQNAPMDTSTAGRLLPLRVAASRRRRAPPRPSTAATASTGATSTGPTPPGGRRANSVSSRMTTLPQVCERAGGHRTATQCQQLQGGCRPHWSSLSREGFQGACDFQFFSLCQVNGSVELPAGVLSSGISLAEGQWTWFGAGRHTFTDLAALILV
jgi:hypothetical protein